MTVDDLSYWARGHGLEALLIVLGAVLGARALHWVFDRYSPGARWAEPGELPEHLRYRQAVLQALQRTAVGLLWFTVAIIVLLKFNVPVATVLAPATIAAAAVGFGAQRLVADFLSGFFLIAERQFGVGDVVQVAPPGQTTGVTGTVEELTLRYTRLRTPSGDVLFLPNAEMRQVVNRSRGWSRVDVKVPVPAGADLQQVTDALETSMVPLVEDPRWGPLLLDRPEVAGIESLDLEHIDLRLTVTTTPGAVTEVASELRRRAALVTAAAGRDDA
jgi:small-conductance mechanosensitive channel